MPTPVLVYYLMFAPCTRRKRVLTGSLTRFLTQKASAKRA